MSFNMVESTKILTREELEEKKTGIAMSVILKLERFELSSEFELLPDWQCIKAFMSTANDEMLRWFKRKKHYGDITEESKWYTFKKMIIDRFGIQDVTTFRRIARWKKKPEEGIRDFIERMDDLGIELGIGNKKRHETIKEQLRNANIDKIISDALVNYRFNKESSVNRLNQFEIWEQMENEKRRRCSGAKNIKANNNIVDSQKANEFRNKSIWIDGAEKIVIFDSGAFFNFMSEDTAKEISAKIVGTETKNFSTCLGEPFSIKLKTRIKFEFKGQLFEEDFYILPKRKGHCILIGLEWISKFRRENNKFIALNKRELIECEINTPSGARIVENEHRLPYTLEDKVMKALSLLLEKGYVRPSKSTFLNNIRPVEKTDGSVRITCNFIALNKLVELDKYTLPRIDEMIYKLRDQRYFSKIDLKDGFFQIPLKECDRHKTAFRIKNKLYEWNVMPMGFKNSPAVFQRNMDKLFEDLIGEACFIYVDDILVFGKNDQEHETNLKKVLRVIEEARLIINKEKSVFKVEEVKFLGSIIRFNEVRPGLDEKQAINEYSTPSKREEVQRFMGVVNYYRKFIPNCSIKAEPLLRLLRKDIEFHWGVEEKQAFECLKEALISPKVLTQPDYSNPFILETDASNIGLGAILSQEFNGIRKPIAYASRKLGDSERNYSISEKEMLAALWAMENFDYFLYGREFQWITDHKALEALNTKGTVQSARIERWMERIRRYKFIVIYKKGSELSHVDALSRVEEVQVKGDEENNKPIIDVSQEERRIIAMAHEKLVHRGCEATSLELAKEYDWSNLRHKVKLVLKDCLKCKMYNPLRNSGSRFIETFEVGEKLGYDIMGPIEGRYIVVAIDYFSRKGFAKVLHSREACGVLRFLKEIYKKLPYKCLVSDNAKENISKEVHEWTRQRKINNHFTTAYHHQSNGRVERLNRTITEGLNKIKMRGALSVRLNKVIEVYNNVIHSAIGMPPNEAVEPKNWTDVKRLLFERQVRRYSKRFKNKSQDEIKVGDAILVKNEKYREKKDPKFKEEGEVIEKLGNKTFKIKMSNNKETKKHIEQLRVKKEFSEERGMLHIPLSI